MLVKQHTRLRKHHPSAPRGTTALVDPRSRTWKISYKLYDGETFDPTTLPELGELDRDYVVKNRYIILYYHWYSPTKEGKIRPWFNNRLAEIDRSTRKDMVTHDNGNL